MRTPPCAQRWRSCPHASCCSEVIFAASVAWGGWNVSLVLQKSEADQRLAQEMNALNRDYEGITKALPSFGVGGSTMRDAVTFYNGSIRGFPMLLDFMVPLSQVMRAHPSVRLSQLAWQATDDPKATPRIATTAVPEAPPVKSVGKTVEAPNPQETSAGPMFAGGRFEVALIEATVRVSTNDFRGAMAEVEKLAADIGRVEGFRADVMESPLDTSPSIALQGRHAEGEPSSMEPRFVLRVVRERGPA